MASWSTVSPATMRIACRDYVRDRLGLPPFEAKKKKANGKANGVVGAALPNTSTATRTASPTFSSGNTSTVPAKSNSRNFIGTATQWLKGKPAGPKIPYRLPELIAAPTAVVYFCEGEKDADALASKVCVVATTASEGAGAKWAAGADAILQGPARRDPARCRRPGRKHAQKVAKAIHDVAASVKVVDLYPDRSDGSDVTRLAQARRRWRQAVRSREGRAGMGATARRTGGRGRARRNREITVEIARLAKLPAIKYEQERKAAAEALGVRASVLDRLVQDERARLG